MKFILKPSLEHMALVKIVVSLWNRNDVRDLMSENNPPIFFIPGDKQWKKIEKKVIEKVPLLPLPQLLKKKVLGFIKPIGLEISMWLIYHHHHFHVNLPAEFCWTPQGTVDRKRTAEVLLRDENLNVSTRYELACFYCLEDDINQFWNSMPENHKESLSCKFPIISFWSRIMKSRDLGNLHIDYRDQFLKSVCSNNRIATEYFLQKLTPREREESLLEAVKYFSNDDVIYFLISEMNEGQQMEFFENNPSRPYRVLRYFLKWPLQSFFIETANCTWGFLLELFYKCLLMDIVHKVEDGYNDWNYQELFREFWQKSPKALKSMIIKEIDRSLLLPSLFHIKDKENIRLILKDTSLTAKERLIYNYKISHLCERSIRDNEWDFLEFFIRECLPSKNAMLKFKEDFEERIYFKVCSSSKKHQWNQLFSMSKDSNIKYGKTSIEEGESSSSKRFRSLE